MTLPIPTSQLTAANQQAYAAELARRQAAFAHAKAGAASAVEMARRAHGTSQQRYWDYLNTQAGARYRTAGHNLSAQQVAQRNFANEYGRYSAVQKANTGSTLDQLLGKLTPYDPQAAAGQLAANRSLADVLANITAQKQNLAEDYATQSRQLDIQQPEDQRALLSNFAGRGMAYSSGYGTSTGKLADVYARSRAALSTNLNRGTAQASMAETSARSNFLDAIAMILANTTGNLTGQAGQLGLGTSDVPYLVELARRRLAAGG